MKKILPFFIFSQSLILAAQKNAGDTYKISAVIDSAYGIIMYNQLIGSIGGDSIRYDAMKLPLQGLVIDMYDNGQMLHKGSYNKGKLVSFNNYYPDGKKERSFVNLSTTMNNLKVFYKNGRSRSTVDYKDGEAKKWIDYYENGQMEFCEEYSGDLQYLLSRKGFKENGKPDYDIELLNSKIRKYGQKEFYPDGKLHEKGELLYFADAADLRKDGIWQTYSEKGNLILVEHFTKGEVMETQDSLALMDLSSNTKKKKSEEKKVDSKQPAADNKKEAGSKKSINSHSPVVVPSQFKFADKDKNGKISAPEVSQAITTFFEDESGKLKPEDISKLIDFFFDQ